ncbi:MAG: hypothetical protein PHX25_00780 [Candidatus Pacebacteria bacterium]|nr:hypothetical protein [Candidatus Paceibacterota bacterium]
MLTFFRPWLRIVRKPALLTKATVPLKSALLIKVEKNGGNCMLLIKEKDPSKVVSEEDREDQELVLQELIVNYGWVLHNPILLSIVEESASIRSAEKYILSQFEYLDNKHHLARAVKNAVRIKMNAKKEIWPDLLKKPKGSRLSDLFVFGYIPESDILKGVKKLIFSKGLNLLPSKIATHDNWPLFLREFAIPEEGLFDTSVDAQNSDAVFLEIDKLDESFWGDRYFDRTQRSIEGYEISFSKMDNDSLYGFDPIRFFYRIFIKDRFVVRSQIVKVKPQAGETYSRFYKVFSIYSWNYYGGCCESIDVFWPIDSLNKRKEGTLIFSKELNPRDGRNDGNLYALLRLEFLFDNSFNLFSKEDREENKNYISIRKGRCVQESFLFQKHKPAPSNEVVCEAVSRLYRDFADAWIFYTKNTINLHDILNERLLTSPPEKLLHFFTEKV